MAVTEKDVVKGAALTETAEGGIQVTRMFEVSGLTGSRSVKLFNALFAPSIPAKGDAHPTIPNIFVQTRNVNPDGATTANVSIIYKPHNDAFQQSPDDTQPGRVSVGAVVQSIETNIDALGGPIIVFHEFRDLDEQGNEVSRVAQQTGTVRKQVPTVTVSVQRKELFNPLQKALEFAGKTNKTEFLGDILDTWLCTNITGQTNDGGESFDVNYMFQRADPLWLATVCFIDPDTNQIATTENAATGEAEPSCSPFRIYERAEFNDLNLGL